MEDKIQFLKDYFLEFLVENRKIYFIFSVGIYVLDDKICFGWFDVMKQLIVIIFEDDKKKSEEFKRCKLFVGVIVGFFIDDIVK